MYYPAEAVKPNLGQKTTNFFFIPHLTIGHDFEIISEK